MTADPSAHEKTRSRRDLKRVKAPPVGVQQSPKTLGISNQTDLAVPLAVPLDAKTKELMAICEQMDEAQRCLVLVYLRLQATQLNPTQ